MEINSNILNIHHPVSISGKRKTLDAPGKEVVGVVTPPCDTGLFVFKALASATKESCMHSMLNKVYL